MYVLTALKFFNYISVLLQNEFWPLPVAALSTV